MNALKNDHLNRNPPASEAELNELGYDEPLVPLNVGLDEFWSRLKPDPLPEP